MLNDAAVPLCEVGGDWAFAVAQPLPAVARAPAGRVSGLVRIPPATKPARVRAARRAPRPPAVPQAPAAPRAAGVTPGVNRTL
ncbi:MAG TPA: hypothetical protein VGH27_20865, partial [Streptosporangiaceae bacterium]